MRTGDSSIGLPAQPTSAGLEIDDLASSIAGPFSFAVPAGSCLTITGPSGSGKSLLLRLIADLDAGSGDVRLGGKGRSTMTASDWRASCPYVAATPSFWAASAAEHFTAAQRDPARKLAAAMLFDERRFDAPVAKLSTGERQRIALVRALLLGSPGLLLDEPTGPLDQEATAAVADVLSERLANGLSLVLVTHDRSLAARLSTDRREMRDRRLIASR